MRSDHSDGPSKVPDGEMPNSLDEKAALADVAVELQRCARCQQTVGPADNHSCLIDSDLRIGSMLDDRYLIESPLGRGGMSVVYKAQDRLLHREVAIKILLPQMQFDRKLLLRFQQEAVSAARLNHPNIVKIHEFAVPINGQPYMVMDVCEGTPLARIIKEEGLDPERAVKIAIQACDALVCAHAAGVVHRDLKPGNFIVTRGRHNEDVVRLIDFGIAKVVAEGAAASLTQTGDFLGSPLYMSPEQCRGHRMDARSDIYSMGCVLYEMLTGTAPFVGKNVMETVQMQMADTQPGLTKVMPSLPDAVSLDAIISKAMQKEQAQRYQSMVEMRHALETFKQPKTQPAAKRFALPVNAGYAGIAILATVLMVLWIPKPQSSIERSREQKIETAEGYPVCKIPSTYDALVPGWDQKFVAAQNDFTFGHLSKAKAGFEAVLALLPDDAKAQTRKRRIMVLCQLLEVAIAQGRGSDQISWLEKLQKLYQMGGSVDGDQGGKNRSPVSTESRAAGDTDADRWRERLDFERAAIEAGRFDQSIEKSLRDVVSGSRKAVDNAKPSARGKNKSFEAESLILLAQIYSGRGKWKQACALLQNAESAIMLMTEKEKRAKLYLDAANLYDSHDDSEDGGSAVDIRARALKLATDSYANVVLYDSKNYLLAAEALAKLASLERRAHDLKYSEIHANEALEELKKLPQDEPPAPIVRAEAIVELGEIALHRSRSSFRAQKPEIASEQCANARRLIWEALQIFQSPDGYEQFDLYWSLDSFAEAQLDKSNGIPWARVIRNREKSIAKRFLLTHEFLGISKGDAEEYCQESEMASNEIH